MLFFTRLESCLPQPLPTPIATAASSWPSSIALPRRRLTPARPCAAGSSRLGRPPRPRRWILALGKAALPDGARGGRDPRPPGASSRRAAVVVARRRPHRRIPGSRVVAGDHPEPGPGSLAAAEALARVAAAGSGPRATRSGCSSPAAPPASSAPRSRGSRPADLTALYGLLLGSGLDITAMNRIRKRFSRWGGGKLARALAPARVRVYVVSDVIGDDLAVDRLRALRPRPGHRRVRSAPSSSAPAVGSRSRRRPPAARWRAEAGEMPETPKPGDQAFARVTPRADRQ